MSQRRFALWAALLAAVHAAPSLIPPRELWTRDSSCAANYNQCQNADFPPYFCCPSGQNCIALAGNTTLLCCPDGSDCQRIQPLPCDISLQDGEKNPDAVVKTTALRGTLGHCGSLCCPFGYSCSGNSQCVMDANQNAVPIQTNTATSDPTTSATSAPTSTASQTSTTTTSSTTSTGTTSATATPASTSGNKTPTAAIAGGVTAAVVVCLGAAALAFIFIGKKKKVESPKPRSPPKLLSRSTSSFGNLISNPIIAPGLTIRSDFARVPEQPREPTQEEDPESVTGDVLGSTVNSPDATGMQQQLPQIAVQQPEQQQQQQQQGDAAAAYGGGGGGGYGGLERSPFVDMPEIPDQYDDDDGDSNGLAPPRTPVQHREPSSVSINIFADPNITPDRTPESGADRRYTNMTTFTQMLDSAGLDGVARGESFLPPGAGGANGGGGAQQGGGPLPRR